MTTALERWEHLLHALNGRAPVVGTIGVRDPEYPCEGFDGRGYNGRGTCQSDGHYMCTECSELAPTAPRFTETREGRGDRLRLYWALRVERRAGNSTP